MRVVDLSEQVASKGVEAVEEALEERELGTPFDMYRVPPVRGVVARLGDQDHAVILVAHHVRAQPSMLSTRRLWSSAWSLT